MDIIAENKTLVVLFYKRQPLTHKRKNKVSSYLIMLQDKTAKNCEKKVVGKLRKCSMKQ